MVRKKKILIVEDEKSLLKLETILLTSNGFDVRAVSDGQAALDVLAEEKPDLVLLDIVLPRVDGFDVCQSIKSNQSTKDIPVVMLTAKTSLKDKVHGQEVGADHYITKPFQSAKLIETLRKLLNRE